MVVHPGHVAVPAKATVTRDRLMRNNKMRADAMERLNIEAGLDVEERVVSTAIGAGGELVPPLWLE